MSRSARAPDCPDLWRPWRTGSEDTPSAAWIANGLAVTSALEGEYEAADAHYGDALRLSSRNPRIAANFIRMLVAAGRIDDAAHAYEQYTPSHWPDDDGAALSRLIEQARLQRRIGAPARPPIKATDESRVPGHPALESTGDDAPPSALDPDLAMRLYLSDALSGQAGEDTTFSRRFALPHQPVLLLHLDDQTDPSTPPAADADTAPNSDLDAVVSGASAPGLSTTPSASPLTALVAAQPYPVPEPEAPVVAPQDDSSPTSATAYSIRIQTQYAVSHHRARQVARHACRSHSPAPVPPEETSAQAGPDLGNAAARAALAEVCATPARSPVAAYGGASNAYRRWVEDQVRDLPEASETAASAAGGS